MAQEIVMIKKDAKISIQVGTGYFQKLQELVTSLVAERSSEEIEQFKQIVEEGITDLPEQWMDNLVTISSLIEAIEKAAEEQGFTYISTKDN